MADETRADEPKKTETLEIRLSTELKDALRETANAEGRTVSVVLRGLIDGYLAQARRTSPRSILWEIVMFFRHPIRLLAVAVGILAVSLTGLSAGQAQDMTLDFELNLVSSNDQAAATERPSHTSYSLHTAVSTSFGQPTSVTVSSSDAETIVLDMRAEPSDDESYVLHVALRSVHDEESRVIATPVLVARFGQPARVAVNAENGPSYEFVVRGEKLG